VSAYTDRVPLAVRLVGVAAVAATGGHLTDDEADLVSDLVAELERAYDDGWRQGQMALALLYPWMSQVDAVQEAYRNGVWAGLARRLEERRAS
jgi:hypothetical protein